MSDTILEYLEKFGDKTFDRLPFGEVDALILAQFAYLKFDGLFRVRTKAIHSFPSSP